MKNLSNGIKDTEKYRIFSKKITDEDLGSVEFLLEVMYQEAKPKWCAIIPPTNIALHIKTILKNCNLEIGKHLFLTTLSKETPFDIDKSSAIILHLAVEKFKDSTDVIKGLLENGSDACLLIKNGSEKRPIDAYKESIDINKASENEKKVLTLLEDLTTR